MRDTPKAMPARAVTPRIESWVRLSMVTAFGTPRTPVVAVSVPATTRIAKRCQDAGVVLRGWMVTCACAVGANALKPQAVASVTRAYPPAWSCIALIVSGCRLIVAPAHGLSETPHTTWNE